MALTTIDIHPKLKQLLDTALQSQLDSLDSLRSMRAEFKAARNPHPWLTDARAMLRMLNGDIDIPHEEYSHVTKSGCADCRDALNKRIRYKFHILSTESGQQ